MATTTARYGLPLVNWGSWNGGGGDKAARRKRRRRGETLQRLESLEDRRLLAASISIDVGSIALYQGDAGAAENVTVTLTGTTYHFVSNNAIVIGTNTPGLTISHPGGDPNKVDVDGLTGINLVMNSPGSTADVQTAAVPANVFDTVPEPTYTFNYLGAAADGVLVSSGGAPPLGGGFETVSILSQGATPQFAALFVANKANLIINQNAAPSGYDVTVNYTSPTPAAGLALLTINQGAGDDDASLPNLPIGAAFVLDQGGGNDTASLSIAGTAGSLATTLDGGPGTDVLTIDAGGLALSAANFYVNPGGSVTIQGAVLPGGGITYSNYESIVVNNVAAAELTDVTARSIFAVQGVPLVDEIVGTFTTSTASATAADFVATIDWGDGSESPGTIVQDASDPSIFYVYGSHTYTGATSPLVASLTVRSLGDSSTTLIGSSLVTFNGLGAAETDATTATILDNSFPALVPTVYGVPIHGVEGQALTNVLVGAFTSSATATADEFVATVAWGDGTTTAGTIVQDATNPSVYYIHGSHTYYAPGQGMPTAITVRSLEAWPQMLVNGSPVTFYRPAGASVTQASEAFINDAPIDVSVGAVNGFENIPVATSDFIVATFTDLGGIDPSLADPAATYTATIYWGDGSLGVAATSIERIGTSARFAVKAEPHPYATPGSYPITVVIAQAGEPSLGIGSNFATIADAPLNQTPSQPAIPDATEGVRIVDAVIGSFVDANPLATTNEFKVTVDWGDGTGLQAARVVQPGGVGTTFLVIGSHTYANSIPAGGATTVYGPGPFAPTSPSGDHLIIIAVQDTFGSAVNLYNTVTVLDRELSVSGAMDAASDTGLSSTDGITKDSTPTFTGTTSEGNATVFVYASKDGGPATAIGSTTSDASGAWSFTPGQALADGGYLIQAQAYDAGGHAISALSPLISNLVIDTVGPKVTDVLFDNIRGRVIVNYDDAGGVSGAGTGLSIATVRDANNYRFLKQHAPLRRFLATSIVVTPGTTTGEQVATVQFNGGLGIRGGRYAFNVLSVDPSNLTGVQDVAGNALDGEYYGYFPSGNNVNGGDFNAYLDAIHHTIYPAQSQVGTATPVTPPGRPATGRYIGRGGVLFPSVNSAVRMAHARQPLTAARAARLARLGR